MINATNTYSFDSLPETFSKVQERVENQIAEDKANGFVSESEYGFNSQGELIRIDEFGAHYYKSFADEETGEKIALLTYDYADSDSNGTYDEYCGATFLGTSDMLEKLLEEGEIVNMDGMYLYDTDDNGEFDTLLAKADEYGLDWHTYTRESDESNTFTRGFAEKAKDFCSSVEDFLKYCWSFFS